MKKISVLLVICAFLVAGCTGKKAETKKTLSKEEKEKQIVYEELRNRAGKVVEDSRVKGNKPEVVKIDKTLHKVSLKKEKLPVLNVPYARMTILSFPEEIVSIAIGHDTFFKTEKIKKNVYIMPLGKEGETNLSCWTEKRGYDFHLVIGPARKVDYKINVEDIIKEEKSNDEIRPNP